MTAFKNIRMPNKIAFGAVGGPMWKTTIAGQLGGYEVRNQDFEDPVQKWNVSQNIKTTQEFDELRRHHYNMAGRAFSFPFKDHSDFHLAAFDPLLPEQVFPDQPSYFYTGDDSTGPDQVQLVKRYPITDPISGEGSVYDRPIRLIIPSTFRLFRATDTAYPVEIFSGFTLDPVPGIVEIDEPDAEYDFYALAEYDVQVRYDTDEIAISHEDYNNYNWPDVSVQEVRFET